MDISANSKERSYSGEIEIGTNTAEAVDLFGEEVVFSLFKRGAKLQWQGKVGGLLSKDKTDEEIAVALEGWKPAIGREPMSRVDKANKLVDGMETPEELAQMAARIKERLAEVQ